MNTQNRSKTTYGFIMACIELCATGETHGFQTNSPKPAKTKPSFRKVSLSPFPLTSELESFGRKSTPSDRPWIDTYCTKLAGPRMLKSQLSRVPWPADSWILFTFQPTLQVLQQPTNKHTLKGHNTVPATGGRIP